MKRHTPPPWLAVRIMPGRQAVPMECNVPGFVAEDQPAHRLDRRISCVPPDQPIVTGADNLDDEEDEHLELHAKELANATKHAERISRFHKSPA